MQSSQSVRSWPLALLRCEALTTPLLMLLLHCTPVLPQYAEGDAQLQRVVQECLAREGVLLALARYSGLEERRRPPPSIRVSVTVQHSQGDLQKAVAALRAACKRVLG